MGNSTAYIPDKQKNNFLEFVNELIIQDYAFEEKMQDFCTEIDYIHHTYTTFTYINDREVNQLISNQFHQQARRQISPFSDEVRQIYGNLLQNKGVIKWNDLKCLSLHRAIFDDAVKNGCNAHYFIPVYTEKNCPIGYFICFYNQSKTEHDSIRLIFEKVVKIVQLLFKFHMYQQQINQLTLVDASTELPSYQQFLIMTEQYRNQKKAGVIKIVRLGEFMKIVELFGRDAGEVLLKELGKRLKKLSASQDSDVARYTSSSLIMFTPVEFQMLKENQQVSIAAAANDPFIIEGQPFYMTLKIGIAPFDHRYSCSDMIRFAESAITQSKLMPGTQTNFYIEQAHHDLEREIVVLNHLKRALQQKQLTAYFQPKFELRRGRIASMEALARWISPELGFVSPSEFIPIAENAGLIREIELQIIEQVLKWQQQRQYEGKRIVPIAVNISPEHFYHPLFISKLKNLIEQYYGDPHFLIIEITENMSLFDFERAKAILTKLRMLGISTSVDDFGVGYSSLSYLQKFSFNELKIDQSFSQKIDELATQTIVKSIIQIAHMLDMIVIAEGVETLGQSNILKCLKCDVIQGYYYSRPLPIEEASRLLDAHLNVKKI